MSLPVIAEAAATAGETRYTGPGAPMRRSKLRLVVLATQEKLAYGQTFSEAMNNLFGEAAQTGASPPTTTSSSGQTPSEGRAAPPPPSTTSSATLQQLVDRAIQEFDDYQRLVSQGKFAEAGQKLEQHKRTLEEIRKLSQ